MNESNEKFITKGREYLNKLNSVFTDERLTEVEELAKALEKVWNKRRQVFICGNGGSAANAVHIANDLHYGIGISASGTNVEGLRVEALPANTAVITCLANDTGYENIYANQLNVKANSGDILLVLSGSGNSPNIVNALQSSRDKGMVSFAILAYDGGKCKDMADYVIHFPISDMQIAEDLQLIVGHLCMQWIGDNKA